MFFPTTFYMLLVEYMLFLYMLLVKYMYSLVVPVKVASPVAMVQVGLHTSVYVALLFT